MSTKAQRQAINTGILLAVLGGVAYFGRVAKAAYALEYEVEGFRKKGFSQGAVQTELDLALFNPSPTQLRIDELALTLSTPNGYSITNISHTDPAVVEPRSRVTLHLQMPLNLVNLALAGYDVIQGGGIDRMPLRGGVKANGRNYPIDTYISLT